MTEKTKILCYENGNYVALSEQAQNNISIIKEKANNLLAVPMTQEQLDEFVWRIVDFYFSHSDDVDEFEEFMDCIADCLEWTVANIKGGGICEQ